MATALPQTDYNFDMMDFKSIDNNISSRSLGQRWYARNIGGQAWAFTVRYRLLEASQYREVMGVVAGLRGPLNEASIQPPVIKDTGGTGSITSVTVNGGSQTGGSLNVTLTGASGAGVHVAGDFFTIGSDTKVYQLTDSIDAGDTSITFFPPLVLSPTNGATLNFSDVTFTMRLVGNPYQVRTIMPANFIVELDMIESF
jgi:hypothetical protein